METKTCARCHYPKPLEDFTKHSKTLDRLGSWCRGCRRTYAQRPEVKAARRSSRGVARLKAYGLTVEDFNRMLVDQGGACAICGQTEVARALAVDHSHDSGRVRGLLCGKCNRGIGLFLEDPRRLRAAAAYLERNGCAPITEEEGDDD